MRLLLFGATDVGYMIVSRMYIEHDITLISDKPVHPKFNSLDISIILGSGADIETLVKANAKKASYFIACSSLDESNILACWTVKKLADVETVCFLSKEEIYANLSSSVKDRYQTQYDIDTLIWPEQLLTQDIFRIIMAPEAIDVEYFDDGAAKLFEYSIKNNSPLRSAIIKETSFPQDVLIVGIYRNNSLFIPNGDTKIQAEDRVIFMGTAPDLDLLATQISPQNNGIKSVAIIGGGNVGYLLALKLEHSKINVKIVENKERRCNFLAENLQSSLVLNADGTDLAVLEEESIGSMDVVVCVTNNDEKNLLCSLLVKQLGAKRVVTRVDHMSNAQLFQKVGIDVVVSPWESAMKELYNHFTIRDLDVVAFVEHGKGHVVRIDVPDTFTETRIMDLKLPESTIIGLIKRRRNYLIPDGPTVIRAQDRLKIFTLPDKYEAIAAVFNK